jgi:proteic killer suppression protein
VIVSFVNEGTTDVFNGKNTKAAGKVCPPEIFKSARKRLDTLAAATLLDDLSSNPGANLESLQGKRAGQYSVRINKKYRVCFQWTDKGPADVEIVDYHDE